MDIFRGDGIMGYYSSVEYDIVAKKDKIKAFNAKIKELKDKQIDCNFYFENLRANEETGQLYYTDDEYNRKHYGDEELMKNIVQYLEDGRIIFHGEDGESWGYEINNGMLFELIFIIERGDKI
jgi:hypothetical protein